MKKVLLVVFLVSSLLRFYAQQWQILGPDENNRITPYSSQYDNVYPSLFLRNGVSYVSFRDKSTRKAFVKKYEGNTWQFIGDGPISESTVSYSDIVVDDSGTYIAYTDGNAASKATVKKFDGKAWQFVGLQGFTAGATAYTCITSHNNTLYVAYQDGSLSKKISVQMFNGVNWEYVGSAGFSKGAATEITISNDASNLYVCFRDEGDGNKASVMKLSDAVWQTIGMTGISPGRVISLSFGLSKSTPFVFYMDDSEYNTKLVVRKFDGTNWVDVGNLISESSVDYSSIAFDGDQPYIAYHSSSYSVGEVKRLINNVWEDVGYLNMYGNNIQVTVDNNIPFVLSSGRLLEVQKFESQTWKSLGVGNGIGKGEVLTAVLNNVPYIAYFDTNSFNVTVKKFNGTTWDVILQSSVYYTTITGLTLSVSGNALYLGYVDNKSAIARKYDGTSWQLLSSGTIYNSLFMTWSASFGFDGGATWVAYKDPDASDRLTVKKLNGSTWTLVGTAGFATSGTFSFAANGGMPYLAYIDAANGNKVTVKKFDGTNWSVVGSVMATPYSYSGLSLVFGNNVPYVHFQSNAFSPQYLVKKLNGTAWSDVSSTQFTTEFGSGNCKLAFGNNQLYALYTDNAAGSKPAIKKFNGVSWVSPADWVATGSAVAPSVFIDEQNLIAAYNSDGIFVKRLIPTVLAVTILDFNLKETLSGSVIIDWNVVSAKNNSGFLVERSRNGKDFEIIGQLEGNDRKGTYSLEDMNPLGGQSYYRLKEIDINGQISILETQRITTGISSSLNSLYPNPSSGKVSIKNNKLFGYHIVNLINSNGTIVQNFNVKFEKGITELILDPKLGDGVYFIRVKGEAQS